MLFILYYANSFDIRGHVSSNKIDLLKIIAWPWHCEIRTNTRNITVTRTRFDQKAWNNVILRLVDSANDTRVIESIGQGITLRRKNYNSCGDKWFTALQVVRKTWQSVTGITGPGDSGCSRILENYFETQSRRITRPRASRSSYKGRLIMERKIINLPALSSTNQFLRVRCSNRKRIKDVKKDERERRKLCVKRSIKYL